MVTADGNWYYWNGTAWFAGGVYQGTSNPEIEDIRLGADGTTYDTAGDAVRGQVDQLNETLATVQEEIKTDFSNNTWLIRTLSNGVIAGSTNRIATTNFIAIKTGDVIFSETYDFVVSQYTSDDESTYTGVVDYSNSYISPNNGYVRLVSRRTDGGLIQPDDLDSIPKEIFMVKVGSLYNRVTIAEGN